MAKHRRYSRKRGQRRNRRASRKMHGGVSQDDAQFLNNNGFNEEQIEYLITQHPDMDIAFIQLSLAGNNPPFFPEAQTPDQIIAALQAIDADIDNADESLNTTREAISQYSNNSLNNSLNNSGLSDISSIQLAEEENFDEFDQPDIVFSDSENEDNGDSYNSINTSMESTGGKRRKRKTSKRITNKRKMKNSKKTRKHRRRYRGGANNLTTETNMIPYDNQNDKDTAVILAQKLR